MSFFIGPLIRAFLAEQAISLVTQEIQAELHSRSTESLEPTRVDFAILFQNKREMGGLLDLCPRAVVTKGNELTFHTAAIHGKRLVMVETGMKPVKATETVISVFKPQRVINAGFVQGNHPDAKKLRFFVPNRVIDAKSDTFLDLWQQTMIEGPDSGENPKDNQPFLSGTLLSGSSDETDLKKYDPFAVDLVTFAVIKTCRDWNIPCFPLKIITMKRAKQSEHFARSLGYFVRNLLENPKSVLKTFDEQSDQLAGSDLLARKIVEIFLTDTKF